MKKYLLRLSVAIFAFCFSVVIVWSISPRSGEPGCGNYTGYYHVEPIKTIPVPLAEKPDTTILAEPAQYTPLHIPRLKNTQLAFPGDVLNDEPATKGFEDGWLALYKTKKGYELRKARVKIDLYYDWKADREGEKSGRSYSLADKSKPLFMFKGIPLSEAGKINVSYDAFGEVASAFSSTDLDMPEPWRFDFNGTRYGFVVEDTTPDKENYQERHSLVLANDSIRQVIYQPPPKLKAKEYPVWMNNINDPDYYKLEPKNVWESEDFNDERRILWTGDIDDDGRLDLMLHLGQAYPGGYENRYVLYISSQARDGELVAPVAAFESYEVD